MRQAFKKLNSENKNKILNLLLSDSEANSLLSKSPGIQYGRISDDGVAAVGRNGELFLYRGNNNIEELYSDIINIDVEKWLYLIKQRFNHCKKFNAGLIQILIPEKTSVLYWKAPFKATRGSKSYEILTEKIHSDQLLESSFFNIMSFLQSQEHNEILFRRYDTHFSTIGCKLFSQKFFEKFFGFNLNLIDPIESDFIVFKSDLAGRFSEDGDISESLHVFKGLKNSDGSLLQPHLVDSYDPASGHMGIRRVWRCSNAPIDKKIVCFGNSFFERGSISCTLSWWFCRLFKEFHFIWDSNFDYAYVDEVKPDYVIGQTIERFLRVTPGT